MARNSGSYRDEELYDEKDEYGVYSDYGDDYDYDSDYNEKSNDLQRQHYKLESEYDVDNYSYLDEEEKDGVSDDEEDEYEEIDKNINEQENEEMLQELEELDDEEVDLDDDDLEEEPTLKKAKKKVRKSKSEKKEVIDHSGVAVRQRFYTIMEDYHSGDSTKRTFALERAMKELEGFIHLIIKRSYSTYTRKYFYDLLQEGYLGVAIGMEKYDPDKSMPTTFFYPYIKHEMQGFITRNVDKTTSHYSSNIKKINKVIQEFEEKGIRYTNVDIAIQTGMTIETVDQSMAIRNYRDEVHIDACPPNIIDNEMEEVRHRTPEKDLIEKETTQTIHRAINNVLNEDEIKVLEMHFGLNDKNPVSEGEISRNMGIPKDKVKRLLNRAIRKLRNSELVNVFGDNMKKEEKLLEDIDVPIVARDATQEDIEFLSQIGSICDD